MKLKQRYFAPTPKKWRKLGDALLGISTFISSFALYQNVHWVVFTTMGIGIAGKFLTNFFTEDEVKEDCPQKENLGI